MEHSNQKQSVLITGASKGIGYEMAKILASKKYNLILVARNLSQLQSIQKEFIQTYSIEVSVFSFDLSAKENAFLLFNEIKKNNLKVDMLINNAGVGNYGSFIETSLEDELKMIELNIASLVVLTKLFAREMALQKSGKILNIASLLSFLPFPYYAVYSATKSFVLAFTETISAELEGSGVIVTALCPGPVATDFQTQEMMKTNAMSANRPIKAEYVAKKAIELLLKGKGKKIPGFNNWFISNLPRITPDFIMMKIKKHLASQK